MLQNVVEYLVQNLDEKENVKEGTESLKGLTKMERKAIRDVFEGSDTYISPIIFW
ncbi:MAG: competence pheromone ComX [Desulfosporosinus sp.]